MSTPNTIEESITKGKEDSFLVSRFYLKSKFKNSKGDDIIINFTSVIDKYLEIIIKDYTEEVELTEEEFSKYKYKPKVFCYDIYKTTELWAVLLRINQMASVVDFNKRKIRVFSESFLDILSEILILEKEELEKNEAEIL